jgi:SAM-dependent methyltransferase
MVKGLVKRLLPPSLIKEIVKYTRNPPVGRVAFGDLRTLHPISKEWGYDRGKPIDRYYMDRFFAAHAAALKGHVLEVGDDMYTRAYGGARVMTSDILHVSATSAKATIVADLRNAGKQIADNTFDCVICTQTLQYIYELEAAVATLFRIAKPGGAVLVTVPGIAHISRYDMEHFGEYWRFTSATAHRLFADNRAAGETTIVAYGNVLAGVAFLHGLAAEELSPQELDFHDPDFELLVAVKATKAGAQS